jgi:hypothetical protein
MTHKDASGRVVFESSVAEIYLEGIRKTSKLSGQDANMHAVI